MNDAEWGSLFGQVGHPLPRGWPGYVCAGGFGKVMMDRRGQPGQSIIIKAFLEAESAVPPGVGLTLFVFFVWRRRKPSIHMDVGCLRRSSLVQGCSDQQI